MKSCLYFFFNDTATTEIYTLSLHDALPISGGGDRRALRPARRPAPVRGRRDRGAADHGDGAVRADRERRARRRHLDRARRSEEHTSELQSRQYLVCRLLLEKKKITTLHVLS